MTCVAGVVLTGGSSRRLGVDKATLILDGETLAVRAAHLLSARCSEVVEVGAGITGLRSVRETPAGAGPLAALVAGADALRETETNPPGSLVLLACDLPSVAPALDALIAASSHAEIVIPVDESGRRQYVCARYGSRALVAAAALVADGERSLHALVESFAEVLEVGGFPPDTFADIDEPADAHRAGIDLATAAGPSGADADPHR